MNLTAAEFLGKYQSELKKAGIRDERTLHSLIMQAAGTLAGDGLTVHLATPSCEPIEACGRCNACQRPICNCPGPRCACGAPNPCPAP